MSTATVFGAVLLLLSGHVRAATTVAESLWVDLGCGGCHLGPPGTSQMRELTPDLGHAGLRFNPAYLFDFLQNPVRVRHHIGRARMPGFHLSERESLALTLYLGQQTRVADAWPDFPTALATPQATQAKEGSEINGPALIAKYQCSKCHGLDTPAPQETIDLTSVAYRLNPTWVRQYLAAPYVFDGLDTKMPTYFFEPRVARKGQAAKSGETQDSNPKSEIRNPKPGSDEGWAEIVPGAAAEINALTRYLFSFNGEKRRQLEQRYREARTRHPDLTPAHGERIFRALNCVACHAFGGKETEWKNAPDLSFEGSRVRRSWLVAFLQKPTAVRPFGFYPGTGSRMPDFRLSVEEAEQLADFLSQQKGGRGSNEVGFRPRRLSAFSFAKAESLLKNKLPCLGCHRLAGQGGRIGPDLSNLKARLQPDFVYRMVRDPQHTVPGTVMPRHDLPPKRLELIVHFLLQQAAPQVEPAYLSLVAHPPLFYDDGAGTDALYLKYCAACHGPTGHADGFNAAFLPVKPTRHADAAYLSQRPDDTLFDGIFAGGAILNKSHTMPAWGGTLSREQIRALVAHLRKLCRCTEPEWANNKVK